MSGGYDARRRAYELAEVAARLRSADAIDEEFRELDDDQVIELIVAQARLSSLLARWVSKRLDWDVARVLTTLRAEAEVTSARSELDALDDGFPFDEP